MDFKEKLQKFISRIKKIDENNFMSEESTKMGLIVPFFQLLGYDVFNPSEFIPEFSCDVGTKKGEKIDYAIRINNEIQILIETKGIANKNLNKFVNQPFRYYSVSDAKFVILTNGILYQFYTDLEKANLMDLTPFMEVNLKDFKEENYEILNLFRKENFNKKDIYNFAEKIKYHNDIKIVLSEIWFKPTDNFINFIVKELKNNGSNIKNKQQIQEMTIEVIEELKKELILSHLNQLNINKDKELEKETSISNFSEDNSEVKKEKIKGIVFRGETLEVLTLKQVLKDFFEKMIILKPDKMLDVPNLFTKNGKYISFNASEIIGYNSNIEPIKLSNDLYLYSKIDTNLIYKLVKNISLHCGYKEEDIEITYK